MLMCDNFPLIFHKIPEVRTVHALLCLDLACVYNSQSSCVVVKKWLHYVNDKLFSASMTIFSKLY